ncbi:MAG: hybrid sensor histidine kinase/response regulator [Candidatus Parabeggiatoa sp. nov. 1]|nr:MAG: hybrid sensor histidine kinase/response regulator [Gammaproteobacteria bacterium]
MTETTSPKSTLLIIDDMPANIAVLLEFLSRDGFKVLASQSGQQGIETAEYAQPDLILLDVMMPGISGFEVCQKLKANPKTQDIPIIFMTALSNTDNKVNGFQLGAADYITKPLQYEEVLARVNTHIKIRKQQQQILLQNEQLQERTLLLEKRTEELEKRNLELDAFAHTVAHDLKNPLGEMIGLIEVLVESFPTALQLPAKWTKRFQLVQKSGQQSVNIIDALLLLAGVSRQRRVETITLNMSSIVTKVVEQRLVHMIEQYQAKIDFPEVWPMVKGYPSWVEEIWINYVSNGLKYGGQPPYLALGADTIRPGMIRFWVRDNGKGLTLEEQAQLFTPFTRLHQARVEGHGLGLSIVQQIAEKLGGEVGVESELGKGSIFYFTLPADGV